MRLLTAACLVLLFATAAGGAEPEFPRLTGRVVDQAGLLSTSRRERLDGLLATHERRTRNQVVVVTLKSLQGFSIEDYGYRLGRHWGIGQKEKNNGVLLIVAPGQRKVRIEVGYGLEGQLTDALSKAIIETAIVPRFRQGDMAGGIVAGVEAIVSALDARKIAVPKRGSRAQERDGSMKVIVEGVFLLVFMVIFVAHIVYRSRRNARRGYLRYGSSQSGGGSGGGGFSGGGGGFGGGGASGGW